MSTFSLILPICDRTTTASPAAIETMADTPSDLEQLRRRIDEIDDRLQDLLIERIEIVSHIARAQAQQQRRRRPSAGPRGGNHPSSGRRATTARCRRRRWCGCGESCWPHDPAAGPLRIAVYAPPDAPGFWDLARDHYGSHTQLLAYRSTGQVIHAVTEGQAAIGVLPMPDEEEADPWWRHLLSTNDHAPHVIARLPFGARGNARSDGASALAIGQDTPQSTGRDRTLFVTENAADISRGRLLLDVFRARPRPALSWPRASTRGGRHADRVEVVAARRCASRQPAGAARAGAVPALAVRRLCRAAVGGRAVAAAIAWFRALDRPGRPAAAKV